MSKEKVAEQVTEQEVAVKEASQYSIKNAEPVAGNIILRVTNFDQPSTRYYYTPYPVETNVLLYGEIVAAEQDNKYHLTKGDRVLYNGSIVHQSLEDGDKYVVVPINGVMLIWRSKSKIV
jgi:co-chaperonin GroES (HSP10)